MKNNQQYLIDRYVEEIGHHLPVKQRADIQAEIKSMIQDMLKEKSEKTGKLIDDTLTLEVLRDMGKPEKVAATYLPSRYLIGPALFPTFWLVLKIGLAVVASIAVIIFAIRVAIGDLNTWIAVGDSFSSIFNWLILTLGWGVVTFAVIERFSPSLNLKGKAKDWDPKELLRKPDADKIPLSTPIAGIIFTLAALVIFNVVPGIPVIRNFQDGEWVTLITLSDAFYRVLPLINISWVLTVGFHCLTLVQRRWTPTLRLANIGLWIYGIVIIAILLAGPDLVNINNDALKALNAPGVPPENLTEILNIVVRASLGVAIAVAAIQIGTTLYKWLSNRDNR